MAGKVKTMMAKRLQCQQCLASLAEEQESSHKDVRTSVGAWWPADTSTAEKVQRTPTAETHVCSGDEAREQEESSHRDVGKPAGKQSTSQRPTETSTAETRASSSEGIKMSTFHHSTHRKSTISGAFEQDGADHVPWHHLDIREIAGRVLYSRRFEPAMGCLIIINAANIGWTIERELRNEKTFWNMIVEVCLLAAFVAELALRFFVEGLRCLRVPWNLFDCVLIIVTIVVMVFFEVVQTELRDTGTLADLMKSMLVLRLLRLLRLVRALRLLTMCRPMWKLVEGLKHCMGTMLSALALLAVALYLFACFGAELITKGHVDDPAVRNVVASYYSSLPMIILTLFRFISMDNATPVYLPLIVHSPALCVYFLLLVVVVTIALMNLITAVVVDDAISTTKMDVEMKEHFLREKLRQLRPSFKELFQSLASEDYVLEAPQIVEALQSGLRIPHQISNVVNPGRMLDLFDVLDQKDDGNLTENEFVEGLSCLAISDVPLETMQILHVLRSTRREVQLLLSQRTPECEGEMPVGDGQHLSPSRELRLSARQQPTPKGHQLRRSEAVELHEASQGYAHAYSDDDLQEI